MTTIRLEPLRSEVLLRLRPLPETTGLIVRVAHDESARLADVIAVGPECVDVKAGMGVWVSPLIGTEVNGDLLQPEASILAYE